MPSRIRAFHQMSDSAVFCRSLNHSWGVQGNEIIRRYKHSKRDGLRLFLACTRCGTTRTDTYWRDGFLGSRTYSYVSDYIVEDRPKWGSAKTFNANVRQELMKRVMKGAK